MRLYSKIIIAALLLFVSTTSSKASDYEDSTWGIGVLGGLNLSSKFNDKAWKSKTGYHAQIFVDRKLNELFFIRAGFGYSTKGATHNSTINEVDNDISIYEKTKLKREVGYLHAPLSFGIRIEVSEDIALNALIGGYLAYGVSFKNTYESKRLTKEVSTGNIIENDSQKETIKGQQNTYIKKGDFGTCIRFEGEYKNILLGISYEQGIRNVSFKGSGNTHYNKWKNRNATINIGYKFYIE